MAEASTCTQPTSVCPPTTHEKLNAGALAPREASRLLSLFDRFVLSAETAGKGPADRAEWNLLKANIFEVNWLLAAKSGIKAALSLVDLDPTFAKNEHHSALTITVKDQPSVFLTVGDIAQLVVLLEQQLGKKGMFDYNNILNSTVGALKLALADKIINSDSEEAAKRRKTSDAMDEEEKRKLYWPKELTAEGIQSIAGMAITPSGFDDTLEDEAGYGTASLFGAPHIFYPNANLFDSRHIPFAMAPLGNKHVRVYREYEYQSIYTPPHEIVHALQTLISDSQVDGWRHEWEASVACLGLLAHVARKFPFLYIDGLAEETMLGFYQAVVWGHSQVSEDVKAGYRQWRDSGGKIDPVGHGDSGHAVHHNPVGTWYCKARISIESFEYQREEDNCFRFLQEILVSIQKAAARAAASKDTNKAAPEDDASAKEDEDHPPRAGFKDLEEIYLRGGTDKTIEDWVVELLPIETVDLP